MKIAVLIPDRGDRPKLLKHCLHLISRQTIQPDIIELVNYAPESGYKDITQRYRRGYDLLRNKALDLIFLWENDDFYSENYIETTLKAWIEAGKPAILGQRETIYYHIGIKKHFKMFHESRGAAMNTVIKPDLQFNWCPDSEPYTDQWLYTQLKYELWKAENPICIGIKHNVGLTGGQNHRTNMDRYKYDDHDLKYLSSIVDPESLEFYSTFFEGDNEKQT